MSPCTPVSRRSSVQPLSTPASGTGMLLTCRPTVLPCLPPFRVRVTFTELLPCESLPGPSQYQVPIQEAGSSPAPAAARDDPLDVLPEPLAPASPPEQPDP